MRESYAIGVEGEGELEPAEERASGVTVLVDDVRQFRDGRACLTAQTSSEALDLLDGLVGRRIEHLWLDHDLVDDDTAMPVVDRLVEHPHDVGVVHVHTANVAAGRLMMERLQRSGYRVERSYSLGMWTW